MQRKTHKTMQNLSILSSLFTPSQKKAIKKCEKLTQEFLDFCWEENGVDVNTYNTDYESVLQVKCTQNGLMLVCNNVENLGFSLPSKFLRFGLKQGQSMPLSKWQKIFDFVLIDLEGEIDFCGLVFSAR